MHFAHRLNHLPAAWQERLGYVLDCMRIVLGIILVSKAVQFIGNREYLNNLFANAKDLWFIPAIITHYVILAHLAGGAMLIVGLLSRAAALLQIPILLGAVFYVQLPQMLNAHEPQQLEYALMVLLMLGIVVVHGGGKLSVDYLVWGKPASPNTPEQPSQHAP
ncbi:MAG: DoxX family protein [Bacteroidota bacterium]|nr:DoxX family protein [Candidatus Kapabacteria bacterium]MDW8219193.1 DoxX family protein [Bacteroidota bacterium]